MSIKLVRAVFLTASIYDILAGLGFALLYRPIYEYFRVDLPNHPGYVHFGGLFVAIFGIGFYYVYQDPVRNQALILLGILMKLAFVVVVLGHAFFGSAPLLYVPFAIIDFVFMLLFIAAYVTVGKAETSWRPASGGIGRGAPQGP